MDLRRIRQKIKVSISFLIFLVGLGNFCKIAMGHDLLAHKHITSEAIKVWGNAHEEIVNHYVKDVRDVKEEKLEGKWEMEGVIPVWLPTDWTMDCLIGGNCASYTPGDGIVIGSAEEDNALIEDRRNKLKHISFVEHLWDPDKFTEDRKLDVGVSFGQDGEMISKILRLPINAFAINVDFDCVTFGGAYQRGEFLWHSKVLPYYTGKDQNGNAHPIDKSQAYYWLGRVAHLLTDMTVPAHIHNDIHSGLLSGLAVGTKYCNSELVKDNDSFEIFFEYEKLRQFTGPQYLGQEYKYENPPNIPSDFNWSNITDNPTSLLKLFWYTAQKTQYFASDGNPSDKLFARGDGGLYFYPRIIDGQMGGIFSPSLWAGEIPEENIINDPYQLEIVGFGKEKNLQKITDALIPHAMKAVAGLYRLFWHETHPYYPFTIRLYKEILGRNPVDEEVNGWAKFIENTKDISSVVYAFFNSEEFRNKKLTDEQFIRSAYRSILGRDPDLGGFDSFIAYLGSGGNRDSVIAIFLSSQEFSNITNKLLEFISASTPNPTITSNLQILQSSPYYVGSTITAQFTIINKGDAPITFDVLTIGGRLNGGCPNDVCPDFDWHRNITLNPGDSYNYQGNLTLNNIGNYHFFPAYRAPDGQWNATIPDESGEISTLDIVVSDGTETEPLSGKIVFVSDRNGNHEIYIMNIDGTNQINLTNNPADDFDPAWSPDNKKITFVSDRDGDYEIFFMDTDGSNVIQLTNNDVPDLNPAWFPDGSKIIFARGVEKHGVPWGGWHHRIFIMDTNGNNQIQLIIPSSEDDYELIHYNNNEPTVSPDASKILFTVESSWSGHPPVLYISDIYGGNVSRFYGEFLHEVGGIRDPTHCGYPSFSPDGERVICSDQSRDPIMYTDLRFLFFGGIYLLNKDASESKSILSGGFPCWSLSGEWVIFTKTKEYNNREIYIARPDGSDIKRITNNKNNDWDPDWAPY